MGFSTKYVVLFVADQLVSVLLFGPLVTFYWRGTWTLCDVYIAPDDAYLSAWICVAVGNLGMLAAALLQWPLNYYFKECKIVTWFFVYHVYSYIVGFFNVCLWRGIWHGLNEYTGKTADSYGWTLLVGIGLLLLLRSNKNTMAPPLICALDTGSEGFFDSSTRFRVQPSWKNAERYIWDTLFSVVIIHNLVVCYWRGVWGLQDVFFFPDNIEISAWGCCVMAAIAQVVCIPLQLLGNYWCRCLWVRETHAPCSPPKHAFFSCLRILMSNVIFVIGIYGVVCCWRGIWLVCDIWILPDQRMASGWITHIVGVVGLMIFFQGNGVIVKGIFIDGDETPEDACMFPNYWLRWFLKVKIDVDEGDNNNGSANGKAASNGPTNEISAGDKVPDEYVNKGYTSNESSTTDIPNDVTKL